MEHATLTELEGIAGFIRRPKRLKGVGKHGICGHSSHSGPGSLCCRNTRGQEANLPGLWQGGGGGDTLTARSAQRPTLLSVGLHLVLMVPALWRWTVPGEVYGSLSMLPSAP